MERLQPAPLRCRHTFCHSCISQWLDHHKRFCPLCKARVTSGALRAARLQLLLLLLPPWVPPVPQQSPATLPGSCHPPTPPAVLYDITAAGAYREREVPPSPKLRSVGSADGAGDAPLMQRLQDFLGVAGLLDPYELQQQQGGRPRQRLRQESGSGRTPYASARQQQRPGVAPGSAAQAQAAQGPRPYFWRLQQRMQAGAYRPGGGAGGQWGGLAGELGGSQGAVSDEDYVLLWRRQVYDQASGFGAALSSEACMPPACLLSLPLAVPPCQPAKFCVAVPARRRTCGRCRRSGRKPPAYTWAAAARGSGG